MNRQQRLVAAAGNGMVAVARGHMQAPAWQAQQVGSPPLRTYGAVELHAEAAVDACAAAVINPRHPEHDLESRGWGGGGERSRGFRKRPAGLWPQWQCSALHCRAKCIPASSCSAAPL